VSTALHAIGKLDDHLVEGALGLVKWGFLDGFFVRIIIHKRFGPL
jgi:hypothetical protein